MLVIICYCRFMSFLAISNCIKIQNIKPTTNLVLLILANYANEENETYPSKKHLAKMCNCDVRTIQRCLQELLEKKIIEKKERFDDGRQTSNLYTIIIQQEAILSPSPPTNLSPHNTINNIHIVKLRKKENGRIEYEKEFEEFWNLYPSSDHKTKKDKTYAMWKKIENKEELKKCLINYSSKKQGKFIHNPYNWFVDKVYLKYKTISIKKSKNSLAG